MLGELGAIESETGERPTTCPWRAFAEADVIAVIQAYDWHESGQCSEWWGADPEWWLVEATRFYHRVSCASRVAVMKMREAPPSVAPPLGRVVDRVRG